MYTARALSPEERSRVAAGVRPLIDQQDRAVKILCAHGVPKASAVHIVEAIGVELALDIVDQLTSPVTVPAKVPATVPVPVKVPVVVPMKVPTVMEAAE